MKHYLTSIVVLGLMLGGCSSTPKFVPVEASLDCVVSKETTTHNGNHDLKTSEQCTNNPIELAKRQGIDFKTCRQYRNPDAIINGSRKTIRGVICWDENGDFHKFPSR